MVTPSSSSARGGFHRQVENTAEFLDASGGFVSVDGVEQRTAFPVAGTLRITLIGLTSEAREEHLDRLPHWRVITSAVFDLRHRALLTACKRGVDAFEAGERMLDLLSWAQPLPSVTSKAATATAHRRLVASVQEALASGNFTAGLDELAALAGSSPHHLSRVFRRLTGRTITRYRNELRVRAALEDLAAGWMDLAGLAARYGFADHAHLTRMIRHHTASTPSALRRELSSPPR